MGLERNPTQLVKPLKCLATDLMMQALLIVMHLRGLQRLTRTITSSVVTARTRRCFCTSSLGTMPSKLLLAARPETYEQQIGEKRKRIETLFATFNPPELQVFESERENYRMR